MAFEPEFAKIRNLCTTCKRDFSSLGSFDRHRIGDHGKNRRCMTPEEMTADGMREKNGLWMGEENPFWANKGDK